MREQIDAVGVVVRRPEAEGLLTYLIKFDEWLSFLRCEIVVNIITMISWNRGFLSDSR